MQRNERSKMLGTMPMNKLVPTVSVPVMVSMLVQALYNVVDSIFVAKHNPNALTAVSLAYPVQMLMIALSVGMGVGISSLISRKLGARNEGDARKAAWNGMIVELCGCLIMMMIGIFFARSFMNVLVSDTLDHFESIREMGTTYLSTVTTFSFGLFMSICFERMLQATGNTRLSMITQMCGAITNIILDPLMIFGTEALGIGFISIPEMGILGAAIATVIGQFVGMTVGFIFNQTRNSELHLNLKEFHVDTRILKDIVAVGLPSTVMQAIGSVMNVGMNAILSGFAVVGNAAVNVLNVYFKLQSFVFMPVFGLGTGMVAIVGYNFGAKNRDRIYQALKVALCYAIIIMIVGTVIFLIFPNQLMSLFESEAHTEDEVQLLKQMTEIGATAMRIICLHFVLAGISITLSNSFQAVGKGMLSMIISICRQLVVLLPVAWLLAQSGDINMVWWAFVAAELVSVTLTVTFFRSVDKKMFKPLGASTAN